MAQQPFPASWSDDEIRYVNATYSPTSRITEESWLLAAKAMGVYGAWIVANPKEDNDGVEA